MPLRVKGSLTVASTAVLEKQMLDQVERLASRENVSLTGDGLDALKPIIRGGCLKLDMMGCADDAGRIDAAESNLGLLIRALAKGAKSDGSYRIDQAAVEKGINRSAVWPFS